MRIVPSPSYATYHPCLLSNFAPLPSGRFASRVFFPGRASRNCCASLQILILRYPPELRGVFTVMLFEQMLRAEALACASYSSGTSSANMMYPGLYCFAMILSWIF